MLYIISTIFLEKNFTKFPHQVDMPTFVFTIFLLFYPGKFVKHFSRVFLALNISHSVQLPCNSHQDE